MELYIARHGQTEYNSLRRMQGGGLDSPLTSLGVEQAKVLGNAIKDMKFDAIYSSPLKRAMDTTRIVFNDEDIFEKGALTDRRLIEIVLGEAEGLHWDIANLNFMTDPSNYSPPPGGEELTEMIARLDSFLQELASKPYKKVFVLAHGFTMRVVYACAVDKTVATIGKAPIFDNCALARYVLDDGKWSFQG